MSALQKEVLKKGLPPLPNRAGNPRAGMGGVKHRKRDYSPLPWSDFFDRSEDVVTAPGNISLKHSFRVYFRGSSGPVLLLLHGGGHSSLSWAVFSVAVSKLVECEVVAMDIRGHGETSTADDEDLSTDTLVSDVGCVVETLFRDRHSLPPIVLMGHSMGGAIAARVAAKELLPSLVGLIVIDVVEGSAMDSLNSMQSFLRSRPEHFKSLETAVEWSIRSGQLKNAESARVSMPGQVKKSAGAVSKDPSHSTSTPDSQHSHVPAISEEGEEEGEGEGEGSDPPAPTPHLSDISEETERGHDLAPPLSSSAIREEGTSSPPPSNSSRDQQTQGKGTSAKSGYVWRVDLKKTECFWQGWFEGLSKSFVSVAVPKMLILAGVDRLDKELTIAQMQGKFWMHVLSGCGHSVHEDVPDKVAEVVATYLTRQKFARQKEPEQQDNSSPENKRYIFCSPSAKT